MPNEYQNPLSNTSPLTVRGHLMLEGMTLREFARRNGYLPVTVRQVLHRHVGKETVPTGKIEREIIERLASFLPAGVRAGASSAAKGVAIADTLCEPQANGSDNHH